MVEAGAAHVAIMQALKASGAIVHLEPVAFERMLGEAESPLVVHCRSRFFGVRYEYIFGHRGLIFYTKSKEPVRLPGRAETIEARSIWIPA